MKKKIILLAGLLYLSSAAVFADSSDQENNCCPATEQANAQAFQKQELLLQKLQSESESVFFQANKSVHEQASKKVSLQHAERVAMKNIQLETENIPVQGLQLLSDKVQEQFAVQANLSNQ